MPKFLPFHRVNNGAVCLALVAGLSGLAGCGFGTTEATPDAPSSRKTVTENKTSIPRPTDPIDKARVLAAQYNYAGAEKLLAGQTSVESQQELKKIRAQAAKAKPWPNNSQIPHIFYHSLIVDPDRAFRKSSNKWVGYAQYMVTVKEFTKQLEQLYRNGYVLIHPQRIAAPDAKGIMRYQPITLPPGKKPLVLSVDDVSYYEYMHGDGFATDLAIAADGRIINNYTDAAGKAHQGSYDVVPIVDDFVRRHPDFSYCGDKGTLALTGYNGVLGYRTSVRTYGNTSATQKAQATAKQVANALKAQGWNFASHSWGHISMTKQPVEKIQADAQRWDTEVRPIVGDTAELIYPFGADIGPAAPYSPSNPKYQYLQGKEKFRYFANVDASRLAWVQLTPGSLRQARINIDGISLERAISGKSSPLPELFDPASTLDPKRPKLPQTR